MGGIADGICRAVRLIEGRVNLSLVRLAFGMEDSELKKMKTAVVPVFMGITAVFSSFRMFRDNLEIFLLCLYMEANRNIDK